MLKNISFYIKLLLLTLLFVDSSNAIELSIIGFFRGIIDISVAYKFPITIELNNNDFIKKNIFLGINLLNESLNYVISIYVQRIKRCFNNPI